MPAQYPLTGWTPGSTLTNYRQIVFGSFIFGLTAQESKRVQKFTMQTQKLPFNRGGAYVTPNQTLDFREIDIVADVGSGMMGSGSNTLFTADDLEAERSLLAGLQLLGVQKLWVRPDRYCWAYLAEFSHAFFQDGGAFRYASWDCKFIAVDPRYYSTTATTIVLGTNVTTHGDSQNQSAAVAPLGNARAYPTFTLTGLGGGPQIEVVQNGYYIAINFSTLVMAAGDTLVVACDPRPEVRSAAAIYTPSGGDAQNALKYVVPATDFANIVDASEFFPFLAPSTTPSQFISTRMRNAITTNYSSSVTYNDTWV